MPAFFVASTFFAAASAAAPLPSSAAKYPSKIAVESGNPIARYASSDACA